MPKLPMSGAGKVLGLSAVFFLFSCVENQTEPARGPLDFSPQESPIRFLKEVVKGPFTMEKRILIYTVENDETVAGERILGITVDDSLVSSMLGATSGKRRVATGEVRILPDTVMVERSLALIWSGPAGAIFPWFGGEIGASGALSFPCSMDSDGVKMTCQHSSSLGSTGYQQSGVWENGVGLVGAHKRFYSPGGSDEEFFQRL